MQIKNAIALLAFLGTGSSVLAMLLGFDVEGIQPRTEHDAQVKEVVQGVHDAQGSQNHNGKQWPYPNNWGGADGCGRWGCGNRWRCPGYRPLYYGNRCGRWGCPRWGDRYKDGYGGRGWGQDGYDGDWYGDH